LKVSHFGFHDGSLLGRHGIRSSNNGNDVDLPSECAHISSKYGVDYARGASHGIRESAVRNEKRDDGDVRLADSPSGAGA
jgi:hypothetical protein